jgi:hypothetical protein
VRGGDSGGNWGEWKLISPLRGLANRKGCTPRHPDGDRMTKNMDESERRKLDLQLDRELEETFPASDALKITRRQSEILEKDGKPKVKRD